MDKQLSINSRKNRKQRLVDYKGGKCYVCGYNRCNRALEFHHLDSALKKYSISKKSSINTKTIKEDLAEVDKCVLLCANCHREVHDKLIDLYELNNTI